MPTTQKRAVRIWSQISTQSAFNVMANVEADERMRTGLAVADADSADVEHHAIKTWLDEER
jgi:hypothetical protein